MAFDWSTFWQNFTKNPIELIGQAWPYISKGFSDANSALFSGIQSSNSMYGDIWKNIIGWLDGTNSANKQFENNLALQHDAQQYNSAEAEKQRNWTEWMSSTSYQRGVEDLRAAGLNPWLSVQGSGAPVSSGATGSSSASSVSMPQTGSQTLGSLVNTAVSAALIAKIVMQVMKKS